MALIMPASRHWGVCIMTFKDAPNGETNSIYTSWMQTAGYDNVGYLRRLESFSKEEIQHLIWLLSEELKQKG